MFLMMTDRVVCPVEGSGTAPAMANVTTRSVVDYVMRIVAGLAIIIGALMIFSALAQGDLFGTVLGAVLIAGGVFYFRRPGRAHRMR